MAVDLGQAYTDKEIEKLTRKINSIYKEAQKDIDKKMKDFNERYKVKEAKYAQQVKDGKITQEQFDNWKKGQVFQGRAWQAKRDEIANVLYNSNVLASQIINSERVNAFGFNFNYASYSMEHNAGVNFGFGIYDKNTVINLIRNEPNLLPAYTPKKGIDKAWNYKKITRQITQGIIQGEKLDQIADRLAKATASQNRKSMLTHARTLMTGAQNAGRLESYRQAEKLGINMEKEWMATLDGHTRDSHADVDGETQPIEHKFSNECMYPGDPGGPPAEVYNCRCTMVSNIKKYPDKYKRRDNINGESIRNMSYREWKNARRAESKTGIKTKLPTPVEFKRDFDIAKSTLPKGVEWRVDDTYTVSDYEHKKLFELSGGSVVAIAEDGDIVSVCKNLNGDDVGSSLLKVAVANGGDRLDAFGEGLYKFYTKNGFEPVSWTPFNEEYAPHDWVKGRDNPEPVIFYRYTGNQTPISYVDFLSSVNPSVEYDDAKEIRNKLIADSK